MKSQNFAGQESCSLLSSKEKPCHLQDLHMHTQEIRLYLELISATVNELFPAEFMYLAWLADFGSFFYIPSNRNCLLHFFFCTRSLMQLKYFPMFILCHRYLSDFKEVARVLHFQFFLSFPLSSSSNWHFPVSIFFSILYREF